MRQSLTIFGFPASQNDPEKSPLKTMLTVSLSEDTAIALARFILEMEPHRDEVNREQFTLDAIPLGYIAVGVRRADLDAKTSETLSEMIAEATTHGLMSAKLVCDTKEIEYRLDFLPDHLPVRTEFEIFTSEKSFELLKGLTENEKTVSADDFIRRIDALSPESLRKNSIPTNRMISLGRNTAARAMFFAKNGVKPQITWKNCLSPSLLGNR